MSECCSNCRKRLHGIKTDFGKLGTNQDIDTPMEGYICLALAFEGVAYWMVNHDESKGMCEMYSPMTNRKTEQTERRK